MEIRELKRYFSLISQWLWFVVLVTLIAGVTAFVFSRRQTPVYVASARLIVDFAGGSTQTEVSTSTSLVELMQTRPTYQAVADELGLASPSAVSRVVSVSSRSRFIIVSAEDGDPDRAAEIANTFSEVFMRENQSQEGIRYAESIANWENQVNSITTQLDELAVQISALTDAEAVEDFAQLAILERQRNELNVMYNTAFQQRETLRLREIQESNGLRLIEEALPPGSPDRPRIFLNALLASVVTAILAVAVILLIEYLDDTIRSPEQIYETTGMANLGAIAYIKGDKPSDRLIAHRSPRAPVSEAYRKLRTNLSFSTIDVPLTALLVTSPSPGDGKSTTAANMAVVMAQTGQRVLLVDADLRRPVQHKVFDLANNQGLTSALLDSDTPVSYHVQSTHIPGLRLLTSGPLPPNPSELLNSQRMTQILTELGQECDVIVFDTPPALTVADASILAPSMNGCLVVIQAGKTRQDELLETQAQLVHTGAHIFGVSVNQISPRRSRYYKYYYYYRYYSYDYSQRPVDKKRRWLSWLPGFK